MKNLKPYFYLTILIFISLSLISSIHALTLTQGNNFNPSSGLIVDFPKFDYIQTQTPLRLNVFVYNISNGIQITSANCFTNLYKNNGTLILNQTLTPQNNGYILDISKYNFTNRGIYSLDIYCNSSGWGGFSSGTFEATGSGQGLSSSIATVYIIYFSLLVFLFVLCILGIVKLPRDNDKSEEGAFMNINNLKYLNYVLWIISWGLIIAILWMASNLDLAYFNINLFGNLFFILFRITLIASTIIVPIWFIYILSRIVDDQRLKRILDHGGIE